MSELTARAEANRRALLDYVAGPYRGPTAFDVERNIQLAEAVANGKKTE